MAASDSASVGRLLLDLHSDLAEEFRGALAGAPGEAYRWRTGTKPRGSTAALADFDRALAELTDGLRAL